MTALIRPARLEDAEALSELGRRTFIETFVEDFAVPYPADDLAEYSESAYSVAKMRERLENPAQGMWVAERDGAIIGYANTGPSTLPHPDSRPTHMELTRLYLSRSEQGGGLGHRLFAPALEWMLAKSDGPLWLSVWSGNHRAQRFYEKYGFSKAGEYKYPVGKWFDDEFIFRRG